MTYQHIEPAVVGNDRRVLVSELSGRRNIAYKLAERGHDMPMTNEETSALLELVKHMESRGFQYEGAEASFELLALRSRPGYTAPFELEDFLVVERRRPTVEDVEDPSLMLAEAVTKIRVGEAQFHTTADGNGPVNALDQAARKGLTEAYPELDRVSLLDYKVRILDTDAGTEAKVRALIESTDGVRTWNTVGSSADVIEASWLALADAYEYFLHHREEWSAEASRGRVSRGLVTREALCSGLIARHGTMPGKPTSARSTKRRRGMAEDTIDTMGWPRCTACDNGVLVPLSDFGGQGAAVHYKAWVCTDHRCLWNIKIRNGDVYVNEPIYDGQEERR